MLNARLVRFKNTPAWYIEHTDASGKRKRTSTGQTDMRAARIVLKTFLAQAAQKLTPTDTIAQILQWDYDLWQIGRPSEEQARIAAGHLSEFLGHFAPMDLTPEVQKSYFDHRTAEGAAPGYIKREFTVLSGALTRAAESRRIAIPRMMAIPTPKAKDRWLRRDEAALALRYLRKKPRVRHLLVFSRLALYSGPRTEDILSLTWDRVDFDHRKIHYEDPEAPADNKGQASVDMMPSIAAMLRAERRRQIKNSKRTGFVPKHVIYNRTDGVGRIYRAFTRHMKSIGLDGVTPHTLRHTFATWAVQGGADLSDVGPVMGHKRVETTRRYAKHKPDAHTVVMRAARKKPVKPKPFV